MINKAKKAHKSKTMHFAGVLVILGVIESQFHNIKHFIPEEYQGLVLVAIGCVVAYLRFTTTKPLEDK